MAPGDIGLEEAERELGDDPPGREALAAPIEVLGLLLGIGGELDDLVAERADRIVMDGVAQPSDRHRLREGDPVMDLALDIAALVPTVQTHGRERIGEAVGRLLAGKDLGDRHLVGIRLGRALREEPADLPGERLGHDLVGIDVEDPDMAALVLGKALLGAVSRPIIVDDVRAEGGGDLLGAVRRSGVDDDEVVREAADPVDRRADPVGFIARDDEHGKGQGAELHLAVSAIRPTPSQHG